MCKGSELEMVAQYLGLIFTESLNYMIMTKHIAQSAGRALCLLIFKDKAIGGMPFHYYSKCYDSLVQSVAYYGAPIYMEN